MHLNTIEIILGIIILILAIGILVTVSMQHSKKSGLGSVMGGSSDSFYGKNKAKSKEIILKKLTIIFSVALVVLALVLYAYHGSSSGTSNNSSAPSSNSSIASTESDSSVEGSDVSEESTPADGSTEESVEESSEVSAAA